MYFVRDIPAVRYVPSGCGTEFVSYLISRSVIYRTSKASISQKDAYYRMTKQSIAKCENDDKASNTLSTTKFASRQVKLYS